MTTGTKELNADPTHRCNSQVVNLKTRNSGQ